ncbi:hypothetical protein [Aurantiacibacter luteus]|uniref:Inner membrane protein n=1 Tax=Aurantiacibacter luteus TaxID=1581420 RepID=A0A0G9MWK8_9SPHN|nr:hypothetical protein [Aurantiacibacter luteus]KLE34989.1 hypothetical protein AAW00_00330 [Aurantiacibacter luteus]
MDQGHDFRPATLRQGRPGVRPVLYGVIAAFLLGALAMWALARSDALGGLLTVRADAPVAATTTATDEPLPLAAGDLAEPAPTPSASSVAAQTRQAVADVAQQQGGIDARVAALEQRLTRLDIQAQNASSNTARAEALFIAFAARRVIERGEPLDYLADQLRLRFGEDRPRAVQTIIDASRDPVTLDQLLARFEGLAPQLDDAPEGEDVFTRLGREISEIFIVRRETTASPVAQRRIERARSFLEAGRLEPAVSEVRQLPNSAAALDWIADAERYAAAQRALETLETVAVRDPRELRDGRGEPID